MSTGNYFGADLHSSGQLNAGEYVDLRWRVTPRNDEISEMEVWYPGVDVFGVELIDPYGRSVARAALGDKSLARDGDRVIASAYHRCDDPNNGDNQVDIFLWPDAAVGTWTTRLYGEHVRDGRYHAWLERDDPVFQSRFTPECAVPTSTTNTICNGHYTIAVGAYDAREPSHPLIPPSSAGPTADNRPKPDVSAPGAGIRAARSSQPKNGFREMDRLTVKTGTSMAAPHVTGICALMLEAAGEYRLTAEQIRRILIDTARSSPPYDETDQLRYGAGRVDAAAAVKAVRALIHPRVPAAEAVVEDEMDLMRSETVETEIHEPEPADVVTVENQHWEVTRADEGKEPAEDAVDETDVYDSRFWQDLATILPRMLVEFGDSELRRTDEQGVPIYDRRQPLVFGPTDRRYSLTAGRFNYHAANFVYNTAYRLGYEVPVYPSHSSSSQNGRAYRNTAATFEALMERGSDDDRSYFSRFFEIVVWPGEANPTAMRAGDLLLRGAEPGMPFGHIAIIVDPILRDMLDSFFTRRDLPQGKGIQCIDAGLSIHTRRDRYGRTLMNDAGIVWDSRLILRFKEDAIDIPRVVHQMEGGVVYRRLLENERFRHSASEFGEFSPRRQMAAAGRG
jgi:subtilase family protein